jgi:hypothetical protein
MVKAQRATRGRSFQDNNSAARLPAQSLSLDAVLTRAFLHIDRTEAEQSGLNKGYASRLDGTKSENIPHTVYALGTLVAVIQSLTLTKQA